MKPYIDPNLFISCYSSQELLYVLIHNYKGVNKLHFFLISHIAFSHSQTIHFSEFANIHTLFAHFYRMSLFFSYPIVIFCPSLVIFHYKQFKVTKVVSIIITKATYFGALATHGYCDNTIL